MLEELLTFLDWNILIWLITTYWWIFPPIALIMWLIITAMIKKIMNRVLYLRIGGTMEFLKCVIKGTNLYFKPNPKTSPITVHIEEAPYLYSKGLSTYRVYVVSEGGGATINFPNPNPLNDFLSQPQIIKELRKFADKNPTTKVFDSRGELIAFAKNVSSSGQVNPKAMVASASISLFERWTTHLAEHLPKTKADWIMIIIYVLLGFGMGIAWGMLWGSGTIG